MKKLIESGNIVFYRKNTTFFVQGSSSDYIYILASGIVKLTLHLPNDEERTLSYIKAQSIVDPTSPLLGNIHNVTATAYTDCAVSIFNKSKVSELIKSNNNFSNLLIMSLAKEVKSLGSYLISSTLPSATLRLASALLQLSYQLSDNNKIIIINCTHEDLASMTSLSRVSVSNALSLLEKENIIQKSRKSIIFQRDNLKAWIKRNL